MAVDRSYVEQNRVQRERLHALVGRLSDRELNRALAAGWTVAAVLGHLAFWDQRVLILVDAWEQGKVPPESDDRTTDWINDAGKPMLLALPPRTAAELATSIADAIDRRLESLPDELVARNAASGNLLNFVRATHRRDHLDAIEASLRG